MESWVKIRVRTRFKFRPCCLLFKWPWLGHFLRSQRLGFLIIKRKRTITPTFNWLLWGFNEKMPSVMFSVKGCNDHTGATFTVNRQLLHTLSHVILCHFPPGALPDPICSPMQWLSIPRVIMSQVTWKQRRRATDSALRKSGAGIKKNEGRGWCQPICLSGSEAQTLVTSELILEGGFEVNQEEKRGLTVGMHKTFGA